MAGEFFSMGGSGAKSLEQAVEAEPAPPRRPELRVQPRMEPVEPRAPGLIMGSEGQDQNPSQNRGHSSGNDQSCTAKDPQLLGLGLNLQIISSYQNRNGLQPYSVASDLYAKQIDSSVKNADGNPISASTKWTIDGDQYKYVTVLNDSKQGSTERTVSVAPNPDANSIVLSSLTKTAQERDVVNDITQANFRCKDGQPFSVDMHTTQRSSYDNQSKYLIFTNIWDKSRVENIVKSPTRNVLNATAGTINSNWWSWLPGSPSHKASSDKK